MSRAVLASTRAACHTGITLQRDAANIKRGVTQHTFLGSNRHYYHPWGLQTWLVDLKQLIRINPSEHLAQRTWQGQKSFVGNRCRHRTIWSATGSWVQSRRHFPVILPDTLTTHLQLSAVWILQNNIEIKPVRWVRVLKISIQYEWKSKSLSLQLLRENCNKRCSQVLGTAVLVFKGHCWVNKVLDYN